MVYEMVMRQTEDGIMYDETLLEQIAEKVESLVDLSVESTGIGAYEFWGHCGSDNSSSVEAALKEKVSIRVRVIGSITPEEIVEVLKEGLPADYKTSAGGSEFKHGIDVTVEFTCKVTGWEDDVAIVSIGAEAS